MEELIAAAEALVTYIEEAPVYDSLDDDGDGHVDTSQSYMLTELTSNLQHAIDDVAPINGALHLIKECFIKSIQTAIQTTRQRQ